MEYFRDVVGLPAKGMDPYDLRDEHVTESECIKVWGPRRGYHGFRFKATHPDKSLKHRIKVLWSLIYQQKVSEFGLRFGMGVLAEKKGIPINWAKFAVRREAKLKPRGENKTLKRKGDHVAIDRDNKRPPKKKVNRSVKNKKVGSDVNTSVKNKRNKKVRGEKNTMARKNPRVQLQNVNDVNDKQSDVNVENGKVGNDSAISVKEDGGKTPATPHEAPQVQVGNVSVVKGKQLNVDAENEKVGNDSAISVKEDKGKTQVMAHEASQVQVGTVCDDNIKHLNVRNNCPNVDKNLYGPTTSKSPLEYTTNMNNKNDMNAPTTSSTPPQSGHEEVDARIVLEKNIEELLSICMTCRVAIATFNNLCSQKDNIDEAIEDSTHRLRNAISCVKKANLQGLVGGKEIDDDVTISPVAELEDATLWHESLLEEKTMTAIKIEAQLRNVEENRNGLKMANQELLGLLLKHYQMFGKRCNILDSTQKKLELLQNGLNELKTPL